MDLERDETREDAGILEVGDRHVIEPGLDRVSAAFDPELVPHVFLEGFAGCFVLLEII
ncbi:hypothetical protein D3C83_252210 [compost metagenome]